MKVFRLKGLRERDGDSISDQESKELKLLFDLPFTIGSDHAEGLATFRCFGQPAALLVVYDSPNQGRLPEPGAVFADVFKLS